MRIGQLELFAVPNPELVRLKREALRRALTNLSLITANGYGPLTPRESFMHSLISTFISRTKSWSTNLSSRGVKALNVSYWTFTVLCCITFFISPWYLFLAFLIPALILNHMRITRKVWKTVSNCPCGLSTSGI
ncbi:hypothetical protein LCGC14_0825800 [marine sediment metagenome]|uniref:Uncharacterized protein n=1 Tax=marine sediment metagenome TaxID=412755 RepID=A0A0F9PM93_9ZZZZ